jgi:hypothetical protein
MILIVEVSNVFSLFIVSQCPGRHCLVFVCSRAPSQNIIRILLRIPLHIRYGVCGLLSNVLFMVAYNTTVGVARKHHAFASSTTTYTVVYLVFIPCSHALLSLLVFGWPERYLSSLLSNFPVGLSALAIGGLLTAYLDRVDFNETIEEFVRNNWTFSHMPPRRPEAESEEEFTRNEFYSSLVILFVTSLWTYALSLYVNYKMGESQFDKKLL